MSARSLQVKSLKTTILLSALLAAGAIAVACGPKSDSAMKIEKGIDALKEGIEANPTDCPKMAAAIKVPAGEVAMNIKEAKSKGEKLPASTKLKLAGLLTTFQKVGPCSKT